MPWVENHLAPTSVSSSVAVRGLLCDVIRLLRNRNEGLCPAGRARQATTNVSNFLVPSRSSPSCNSPSQSASALTDRAGVAVVHAMVNSVCSPTVVTFRCENFQKIHELLQRQGPLWRSDLAWRRITHLAAAHVALYSAQLCYCTDWRRTRGLFTEPPANIWCQSPHIHDSDKYLLLNSTSTAFFAGSFQTGFHKAVRRLHSER